MSLAFPSPEFDQIVAATCHGVATEEQLRALAELLRREPGARDEYLLRVELHSRLASDPGLFAGEAPAPANERALGRVAPGRGDGAEEADRAGVLELTEREPGAGPSSGALRDPASSWALRSSWALAAAACLALLAVGVWWRPRDGDGGGGRVGDTSKAVAMLSRTVDVVWQQADGLFAAGTEGGIPQPGAPLEPGWLRLKAGLAQIVFYSGARMIVEGPAEVRLITAGEVECRTGRLIAEVPPSARGFQVRTPRMDVTDLGTVFGVDVGVRDTGVHVFQGRVEFRTGAAVGAAGRGVAEGQGAIVDGAGQVRLVPASRAGFAALFDLQNKSSESDVLRHEHWRAANRRLDEDPTLLVHFEFEPSDPADWRLPNSGRGGGVMADATIVGCQWTEGRWTDKRALEFRGVSDRVRLEVPGEHDAVTLAAWVRVQGLDRRINSLFMSDGFEAGTVHWSLRNDGALGLTVIGAEPGQYQILASPPVLTLDQFGLWVHLAAVVDPGAKRVVHYLNGQPVSEHALRMGPPFRIGLAELGNWNARGFPRNDPFMIRNFSGAIDEFCLFGRALSGAEIRALHAAGRPARN